MSEHSPPRNRQGQPKGGRVSSRAASVPCLFGGGPGQHHPVHREQHIHGNDHAASHRIGAGGSVVVQKYLDANANGVVDTGDWLVQQFNLTDGQAGMVIDGVTNFNVPGDTDTVSGQITAK